VAESGMERIRRALRRVFDEDDDIALSLLCESMPELLFRV
jgi:hypothetical protein